MRIAGIMSGTSLDGIDVAIIDEDGGKLETLAHGTTPYPDGVRERILAVSNAECHTRELSRLNFELPELYAQAVQATCCAASLPLHSIELIGCHGQTVYHEGDTATPNTLQLGEPAVLVERLGIPVVSNFRPRDIAAGGRGAPLVPFVDQLLFGHESIPRVALNLGGIANITVLHAGKPVIAFDTGPGNMVVDQLTALYTDGRQRYDAGGTIAATAAIDQELLAQLMQDEYFSTFPPKSAGREQYGANFIDRLLGTGLPLPVLIATATAFTARSVALAVTTFAADTRELIAAGGGIHNAHLMAQLAAFLPGCQLMTTAAFGIDPDAKEAIAFAILARETWHHRPGNLPSATGASHPVILGSITR